MTRSQPSSDRHPQRRRIRLASSVYAEVGRTCSVTIAVKGRARVFANHAIAGGAVQVLREQAEKMGIPIYAYCIMPDHIHLVLDPSATCDIVTFVARFKNLVQREAWREGVCGAFWQSSFWDYFLRREEQLRVVIDYVLNNPVRAGLVEQRQDYAFCGSLVFDLSE